MVRPVQVLAMVRPWLTCCLRFAPSVHDFGPNFVYRITFCRWRASRSRSGAKHWFARRATRQTKANAVQALHTCVPFCVYACDVCQALNSALRMSDVLMLLVVTTVAKPS